MSCMSALPEVTMLSNSIEQGHAHAIILLLLLLRLGSCCGGSGGSCAGGRGSGGGGGGARLDLLGKREGVIRLHGDGEEVLEAVRNEVRKRRLGEVASAERKRDDLAHTLHEKLHKILVLDLEHLGTVDRAVV